MSRIDDLIQELCPDGVEFVDLGSVVRIRNGSDYKSLGAGGVPVYGSGGVMTTVDTAVHEGPSVLIPRKGSLGNLFYVDQPFWTVDTIFYTEIDEVRLLPKFFYYMMFTQRLAEKNQAGGVPSMTQSYLNRLRIPMPPLEVQREVVRVLDKFTQLEAELEAELEARRAQLAYYRGATLGDTVSASQTALLGDIAEFKYGFTDKAAEAGTHRFIRITDINPQGKLSADGAKYVSPGSSASEYVVQPGDLLMARTGATYGKTLLVNTDVPAVYASFLIRIRFKDSQLLPAFYWHYAQSNAYWNQANALVSTAGQPQFNANALKRVRVPLPSLEKQASIVRTLNTFDALVNDISIGLPAELDARRKQYEHYRDRLLTFKELTA
ncbi:restriction endonuclease subunit S [Brachybacterium alimentarium]|uniref:restriction endonuclease subunit S n=1 Tax=Brachybacterium alimentarium TaxID=47845 RepID=UPI000DF1A696|nr:restriction endonuclease subunit S [Brachybacterium alimentarium]RCS74085.1 restriction endonuclease subunit S [Brachybacterium alimentarium]